MACSMNWSTGQSSLTAVTLTVNLLFRTPGGGVFISNPFEGEGVGAFLEAGGLIEAMIINLGQNMA